MSHKKLFLMLYLGCVVSNIDAMFIITPNECKMAPLKDICFKTIFDNIFQQAKNATKLQYHIQGKKTKKQPHATAYQLTKDAWKCDKHESQIKALIAFFSQENSYNELFSDMLGWFIKNPLSTLYNVRSLNSSTTIAHILLTNATIRSKFKDYPQLLAIVNFYPNEMEKIVSNHHLSFLEKQQQLNDYLQLGTNPTKALQACLRYQNFECFSFLLSYISWIANNKNIWQEINNTKGDVSKIITTYFKHPLSKLLQQNILYYIASGEDYKGISRIALENLLINKYIFSSCFPLHKAVKRLSYNGLAYLKETCKFNVNALYKNKTPVNLLLSRTNNIFKKEEIDVLELLNDAHFNHDDIEKIKISSDCTKYTRISERLENILNNLKSTSN